jgi:RecA-family ATPase
MEKNHLPLRGEFFEKLEKSVADLQSSAEKEVQEETSTLGLKKKKVFYEYVEKSRVAASGAMMKSSKTGSISEDENSSSWIIGGLTGLQHLELPEEQDDFLWEPFISFDDLGFVYGQGGCNKSTFLRALAFHIVKGENSFMGFPLHPKHNRVIYFAFEDSQRRLKKIMHQMQEPWELADEDMNNIGFVYNTLDLYSNLEKTLEETPVDLIIVDPFTELGYRDTNSSDDTRRAIRRFREISSTYKCPVIFVSHPSKSSTKDGFGSNNMLGSVNQINSVRLAFEMKKKSGRKRELKVTKGNYVPEEFEEKVFELEFDPETWNMTMTGEVKYEPVIRKYTVEEEKEIIARVYIEMMKGSSLREGAQALTDAGFKMGKDKYKKYCEMLDENPEMVDDELVLKLQE